ncbi:hypothetical protein CHU95_03050 [Niveispirillum lacus]|uniref:DUF2178 domain-containing protein n=1 Tax=Niveispirillum lacus TaxID=1981099 RepID=A0A255Z6B8_9PROT|nr:hypothetical protein [Niveispirillum lacus]OYQ36979.1 hypothetical protein CHU95_03050 [Niveispirillum lacus]
MSFREKLAWLRLLALIGFGGAYFGPVFGSYLGLAMVPRGSFWWMIYCVVTLFIGLPIAAVVMSLFALRNPREVQSPKDERDRQIGLLGTRTGFYVLAAGIILSMLTLHMGANIVQMVNYMLFALLLADLSRLGTQVLLYRRGW